MFGNYVIQKILEYGTKEQKKHISTILLGRVKELSLDMYGCRVIQKAIEVGELSTTGRWWTRRRRTYSWGNWRTA